MTEEQAIQSATKLTAAFRTTTGVRYVALSERQWSALSGEPAEDDGWLVIHAGYPVLIDPEDYANA